LRPEPECRSAAGPAALANQNVDEAQHAEQVFAEIGQRGYSRTFGRDSS
jgi:hypothetical protein